MSYVYATLIVTAVLGAQLVFSLFFAPLPFVLLYPTIFYIAIRLGFGPALLATLASAAGANFFFIGMIKSFSLTALPDILHLCIFVAMGFMIAWIARKQKISEQHWKAGENLFRTFANTIPQLAWIVDSDGNFQWYNQRWYEYTGMTLEQMKHKDGLQVIHPAYQEEFIKTWNTSIATNEPFKMRYPLRAKDGSYRMFKTVAVPIKDSRGKTQWVGTTSDIDDYFRHQRELKKSLAVRDEFLSIASHELKTPLATLLLQTDLFNKRRVRGNKEIYEPNKVNLIMAQTERQVLRLNRLVEDMLEIARIRTGRLSIRTEQFDLHDVTREVLGQFGLNIELCGDTCAVGVWDKGRIEQVINNLIVNAIRYGNQNPITVTVLNDNDHVLLSVKDRGIGIEKEAITKIFDRFERAIGSNNISGLGLGLYIAREIVRSHNGKIWVESELGKGSTFYVRLPRGNVRYESREETRAEFKPKEVQWPSPYC